MSDYEASILWVLKTAALNERDRADRAGAARARRRAEPVRPHADRREFTGGAIVGSDLFIATIGVNRCGEFWFKGQQSTRIELQERGQSFVEAFALNVRRFVRGADISRMTLRGAPAKGHFTSAASVYKIETLLQSTPYLDVEIVLAQRISTFVREHGAAIPEPTAPLARNRKGFRMAIEAAAYAASGGLSLATVIAGGRRHG